MKKVILSTVAVLLLITMVMQDSQAEEQDHFIEPYIYELLEVEDMMHLLCNELIISINPKACVGTWRACIVEELDGDRHVPESMAFDAFTKCMPHSADK